MVIPAMTAALWELVESAKAAVSGLPMWAQVGLSGLAAAVPVLLYRRYNAERKSPFKEDWEQGVVYMYQWPRAAMLPSLSPFCIKLETWFRMADIKYKNVDMPMWVRSKEGMIPFVELNGEEYADSGLIMRDLTGLLGKEGLEAHLNDEQKGAARALEQMLENSTLQSYSFVRYCQKAAEIFTEKVIGKRTLDQIPFIFHILFHPRILSRNVKKRLEAHGIGRHNDEKIAEIGLADLDALSAYLGDKPFLTGDKAVRADATAFGVLSQILYVPIDTPHFEHVQKNLGNLVAYAERMKAAFWPDWEETCATGNLNTDWKSGDKRYKAAQE